MVTMVVKAVPVKYRDIAMDDKWTELGKKIAEDLLEIKPIRIHTIFGVENPMKYQHKDRPAPEGEYPKIVVDVSAQKISVVTYLQRCVSGQFSYSNLYEMVSVQLRNNSEYIVLSELTTNFGESKQVSGQDYAVFIPYYKELRLPKTNENLVKAIELFMIEACPDQLRELLMNRDGSVPESLTYKSGTGVRPLRSHFEKLMWDTEHLTNACLI